MRPKEQGNLQTSSKISLVIWLSSSSSSMQRSSLQRLLWSALKGQVTTLEMQVRPGHWSAAVVGGMAEIEPVRS